MEILKADKGIGGTVESMVALRAEYEILQHKYNESREECITMKQI